LAGGYLYGLAALVGGGAVRCAMYTLKCSRHCTVGYMHACWTHLLRTHTCIRLP